MQQRAAVVTISARMLAVVAAITAVFDGASIITGTMSDEMEIDQHAHV